MSDLAPLYGKPFGAQMARGTVMNWQRSDIGLLVSSECAIVLL